MVSVEEFAISTANDIPGFKIIETKGFIYGLTVRSRGAGGQIGAGVKSLFGGEIRQYVTMMEESRDDALERVIAHAKELGANGIIAISMISIIMDPLNLPLDSIILILITVDPIIEPLRTITSLIMNAAVSCFIINGKRRRVQCK